MLTLADYAANAQESDRFAGDPQALRKWCYGYFGEIGGLLAAVKKVTRDELHESEADFAGEEIGDALWYLVAIARATDLDPDDLGLACLESIRDRFGGHFLGGERVSFLDIDQLVSMAISSLRIDRSRWLEQLANDAGQIVQIDDAISLPKRLGWSLALLAISANSFGLDLVEIADNNLSKIQSRWRVGTPAYTPFFDPSSLYPEYEQFPRHFDVRFEERNNGGSRYVVQSINSVFVGDRLTDNNAEEDGYRFHDVFHLAYVAFLGWSPVVRSLLKRKRKSKPAVDENEDGARAMIIEEGIATWVFNHAKTRGYFRDVSVGRLDYALLKQIRLIVTGYEVERCPLWQWELAILEGFKVFHFLRENKQGIVRIDMENHTLTYHPIFARHA